MFGFRVGDGIELGQRVVAKDLIDDLDGDHEADVALLDLGRIDEIAFAFGVQRVVFDREGGIDLLVSVLPAAKMTEWLHTYVHGVRNVGDLVNNTCLVCDCLSHWKPSLLGSLIFDACVISSGCFRRGRLGVVNCNLLIDS